MDDISDVLSILLPRDAVVQSATESVKSLIFHMRVWETVVVDGCNKIMWDLNCDLLVCSQIAPTTELHPAS